MSGNDNTSSTNTPSTSPPSTSTKTTTSSTSSTTGHSPTNTPPHKPSEVNNPASDPNSTTSGGAKIGYAIFAVLVIVVIAVLVYIAYKFWQARRRGLPPPQLNPFSDANRIPGSGSRGGIVGWAQDTYARFSRQRRAGGAYEGTSAGAVGLGAAGSRRSRRPAGALDPDEAWDARVGHEADIYGTGPGGEYYEEQELSGLRGRFNDGQEDTAYSRGSLGRTGGARTSLDDVDIDGPAGRRQSELDERYDEEMGRRSRPGAPSADPFGETAEPSNISLRDVSPRPAPEGRQPATQDLMDSPTERRSMFKENV